jgi:superfamily II DNA or RNA helicase
VLATTPTASSEEFLGLCSQGEHLFVVADEVHRLGSPGAKAILSVASGPRLGLSATPRRAGDPTGTAAILNYFGDVVPPPFTIYDAIQANALTPYAYHVHRIELQQDEQQQWDALTSEIRKLTAQARGEGIAADRTEALQGRLKMLLIRRARIVKGAREKPSAALRILSTTYSKGQRWIVYCDDRQQMTATRDLLRADGIEDVLEYHTAMEGDPARTLDLFTSHGGIVVSIRCLDEGVDIPAVSHALILASSKNPREYIQRRGRVLRKSPGKALAQIHDVLVSPSFSAEEPLETAILEGELARAIEFGQHAINPGCIADLMRLASEHQLDLARLASTGDEEEGDEEVA